MDSRGDKPAHDSVCLFKCTDYTTIIVGRYDAHKNCFYVQRGDGTRYEYGFGIAWFKPLILPAYPGCEPDGHEAPAAEPAFGL